MVAAGRAKVSQLTGPLRDRFTGPRAECGVESPPIRTGRRLQEERQDGVLLGAIRGELSPVSLIEIRRAVDSLAVRRP